MFLEKFRVLGIAELNPMNYVLKVESVPLLSFGRKVLQVIIIVLEGKFIVRKCRFVRNIYMKFIGI